MLTRFFGLLGLAAILSAATPALAQDAAAPGNGEHGQAQPAPERSAAPQTQPASQSDHAGQSPAGAPPAQNPTAQPTPAPQAPASPTPAPPAPPGHPARLPPAGSPPLVRYVQLQFPTQGDVSVIDPQTSLYYIQT